MISTIQDKYALAIVMIDLLDFPCSLWPNIASILGTKRPIFIVGNKVDLLPRDSIGYLHHIQNCLVDCVANSGKFSQFIGLQDCHNPIYNFRNRSNEHKTCVSYIRSNWLRC